MMSSLKSVAQNAGNLFDQGTKVVISFGDSPLHEAIKEKNYEKIASLKNDDSLINRININKMSPLYMATIVEMDLRSIEILLGNPSVDPNSGSFSGGRLSLK